MRVSKSRITSSTKPCMGAKINCIETIGRLKTAA